MTLALCLTLNSWLCVLEAPKTLTKKLTLSAAVIFVLNTLVRSDMRCRVLTVLDCLEDDTIELDFLGKDSIRYYNKVKVHPQVRNEEAELFV